jgi:hypothetical protein
MERELSEVVEFVELGHPLSPLRTGASDNSMGAIRNLFRAISVSNAKAAGRSAAMARAWLT